MVDLICHYRQCYRHPPKNPVATAQTLSVENLIFVYILCLLLYKNIPTIQHHNRCITIKPCPPLRSIASPSYPHLIHPLFWIAPNYVCLKFEIPIYMPRVFYKPYFAMYQILKQRNTLHFIISLHLTSATTTISISPTPDYHHSTLPLHH